MKTGLSYFKYLSAALALFIFLISPAPGGGTLSAEEPDVKAPAPPSGMEEKKNVVLFREEFPMLDRWLPITFPKIERHSDYSIINMEGKSVLKLESDNSASGIRYHKTFNVYDYPRVSWSWLVNSVYEKGDATKKSGDDYPIRIYIIFKYDPETASFGKSLKYGAAKVLYGEYPPDSSLNYIWANQAQEKEIIENPFTDRAMMIPLREGTADLGQWHKETINILDDYRRAFGEDPPKEASIAIMNDSDNTGEASVSFIDYIEVYR